MTVTDTQLQALVHLAVTTQHRAHGDRKWDEAGVAAEVRKLNDQGLSAMEIIDRTLAHARNPASRTPAAIRWPADTRQPPSPDQSSPAEACPHHPARPAGSCIDCAGDRAAGLPTPPVRREDPPAVDEHGHRLRHRPLRDLVEEHRTEILPTPSPRETR